MELLEFARGPGLAFSLGVFGLGLAWRIAGIFRRPARVQLSAPRRTDVVAGGMRAIFAKMLPPKRIKTRVTAMANAYVYHLGIALVVLAFAPHIEFVQRYTGLSWPALPDWVTYLATAATMLSLLLALVLRLTDAVLRLLSSFDDYFSWCVTMLPFLTGMALLPRPADPGPLAVHLLSLELLLVWLPFGKLAHAVLVFVSRYRTGADFTRKGAAL